MALLLPFIAFLIGYGGVQQLQRLRPIMAMLLARLFIPVLIIYNMVFDQEGSFWLIGFSIACSILFFTFFYVLEKNKLTALCFSYLNGAWLGFPLTLAIFGPPASGIVVALYIGGSLFGNVCAIMAVSDQPQNLHRLLKNILFSPPVMALLIACILSYFDWQAYQAQAWLIGAYDLNKILVTFCGMCILGMWLSQVKIAWNDLKDSLLWMGLRSILAALLCTVAYFFLPIPHSNLTYAVIFMFFLLPPAANIVALETYYQGTGHSAKYIASGTLVSALFIMLYASLLHVSHIL